MHRPCNSSCPNYQVAYHSQRIKYYARKFDSTRKISTGEETTQELIDAFGSQYQVIRVFGNESFEDTVKLFSGSKFAFGVHGAGMTNMLFMHPNTTIVEVRPENFNINLLEVMGGVLGLNYYVFRYGKEDAGPVFTKGLSIYNLRRSIHQSSRFVVISMPT